MIAANARERRRGYVPIHHVTPSSEIDRCATSRPNQIERGRNYILTATSVCTRRLSLRLRPSAQSRRIRTECVRPPHLVLLALTSHTHTHTLCTTRGYYYSRRGERAPEALSLVFRVFSRGEEGRAKRRETSPLFIFSAAWRERNKAV